MALHTHLRVSITEEAEIEATVTELWLEISGTAGLLIFSLLLSLIRFNAFNGVVPELV